MLLFFFFFFSLGFGVLCSDRKASTCSLVLSTQLSKYYTLVMVDKALNLNRAACNESNNLQGISLSQLFTSIQTVLFKA